MSASRTMSFTPGVGSAQHSADLWDGHGHRDDHYGLKHLDELLGDEGVHREPTLRDGGEEQRGEHHAERMVSTDERHRDPEESAAARETFLVIVLVAEHVIQAAQTGDRAGESHHAPPQVA